MRIPLWLWLFCAGYIKNKIRQNDVEEKNWESETALTKKMLFLMLMFCLISVPFFDLSFTYHTQTLSTSCSHTSTGTEHTLHSVDVTPILTLNSVDAEEYPQKETIPLPSIIDQVSFSSYEYYLSYLANTIGPRVFPSEGNTEAAEFIFEQFEAAGLETWYHDFGTQGMNVVGTLPGGSAFHNECIVVGAHFDTIPGTSDGADDNGSGTAAVMEIARVLSQYRFNYTFHFVAFNAEEIGLHGSQAFAHYLHDEDIPVACVYNFDMLLWDNPEAPANAKYHIIHNGGASEAIATHAANIAVSHGLPGIAVLAPGMWMSDHASFWGYGDPGVWFFEAGGLTNPWIHSAQDYLGRPEYSIELGVKATKNAAEALYDWAVPVSTLPGFPQAEFVQPTPERFTPPKERVPLVLEITDTNHDVNKVELSINEQPWLDVTAGLNDTHCTHYWNATSYYGPTSIRARIYDAAGWLTSASRTLVIDKGLRLDITSPTPGEEIPQGEQYTIWINASDLDSPQLAYVMVSINNTDWQIASTQIYNQRYYYNWTVTDSGPVNIRVRARDPGGFTNTSSIQVQVVQYLPEILQVSFLPLQPMDTDPVEITATVVKHPLGADIFNVQVIYSFENASWKNRRLLEVGADTFRATIGPLPAGSVVRFYIKVQDFYGNIVETPIDQNYASFQVVANPTIYLVGIGVVVTACGIFIGGYLVWRRKRITPT